MQVLIYENQVLNEEKEVVREIGQIIRITSTLQLILNGMVCNREIVDYYYNSSKNMSCSHFTLFQ